MNIFANLKDYRNIKRKREIILLFKENFCDFQLIREHLNEYNFDKEEVVFILNTGLLNERQEANLSSFLYNELGTRFIKEEYKAPERYLFPPSIHEEDTPIANSTPITLYGMQD